jgi:hypothetical protein
MTPAEAIRAATAISAELIAMEDELPPLSALTQRGQCAADESSASSGIA